VAHADTVSGVVLVFGVLAVMLWWQRRGDHSLLWLAVGCAMWGVRGVAYFNPQVYVSPLAFEMFNPVNALISLAALAVSVLVRDGSLTARATKSLAFAVAGGTLAVIVAAYAGRGAAGARFLCFVLVIWILVWIFAHAVRRWHRASSRSLAVLLGLLFASTVHDLGVVLGIRPPDSPSIVFWGFAILLVGVCIMSAQYVVTMLNRAERANDELTLRVAEKSQELERSYEQLREIEREQARTAERERLVRDLHDGLSAQLVTTLRGVERGALDTRAVAGSLQESLDELRLLMDSGDIGDYLPGALASWRNRWEARLQAAGIALAWHIADSVDGVLLPDDTTMHVMRILQEAAANVVKHSRATSMRMSARVEERDGGESLVLEVEDDGGGMPSALPGEHRGRGVRNMAHRANQIGAALQVGPGEGGRGTRVALTLPVTRRAATA
jgi:signal transduction histidine kinase